ncbi:MAG TPA: hypothetical protein VEJ16_16165 [Alphaproteobacteria bacterium]|nr:hypothetical protein [Alphaproteobacteria bacterium]
MIVKSDGIAPLAVYNDLRKIALGDYKNRDARLDAVDVRMTRLRAEIVEYAKRSRWEGEDLREWNNSLARKVREGMADSGPRMFAVFQRALHQL